MDINFCYDIDKDVENFINSLSSKNNSTLTEFHKLYTQQIGNTYNPHDVKLFIHGYLQNESIQISISILKMRQKWEVISKEFFKRAENIFKAKIDENITIYLTTNNRCSYNLHGKYFFIPIYAKYTNKIIMHELFHFYTRSAFENRIKLNPIFKVNYNDIKESLTEILNLEFRDLMGNSVDLGYKQHKNLRKIVKRSWTDSKNINVVVQDLLSHLILH